MKLRQWQREALTTYHEALENGRNSLLWEACPGAGKTTAGLMLARMQLQNGRMGIGNGSRRIVAVVPTRHLKSQWAESAVRHGIHLDHNYAGGRLSPGYNGIAITYQQLAQDPSYYGRVAGGATVLLDEVHHAGLAIDGEEHPAWGGAVATLSQDASFTLALSGTAFRSDDCMIPFLHYEDGISQPDYAYTYGRAVADGVCRPVTFINYGGEVSYRDSEGVEVISDLDDWYFSNIGRRLSVALDPAAGWIQKILTDANTMLTGLRLDQPDAAGLVVCRSQEHAHQVAELLADTTGKQPVVVVSDDASASRQIANFTNGRDRWIVACNMVSEGVDIPRLRVGVYATTISTRLYFRQFVGRIIRKTAGNGRQMAYCYLPVDPRLAPLAREIEEEAKHFLSNRAMSNDVPQEQPEPEPIELEQPAETAVEEVEQTEGAEPIFRILGGRNRGAVGLITNGRQLALLPDVDTNQQAIRQMVEVDELPEEPEEDPLTLAEQRQELGRQIKSLVATVSRETGQPFSFIYNNLNQRQRVQSQTECTVGQLRTRVEILTRQMN